MRKSSILCILLLAMPMALHANEGAQDMHGFKILERRFVKEADAECIRLEHAKSGAQVLKIAAKDPNKTFSIAFRTFPDSDSGAPHILEHSVLNGSRKFPVKAPFDILLKGSFCSFLNAMTMPDWTCYPVASTNEREYFNMMDVYLDAVLHPRIHEDGRILMQEGWHYELADKDAPLTRKGVVYSEMKGVFSDPMSVMDDALNKATFPDNCFGFESGGTPEAIPNLDSASLKEFHKRFYSPSNAFILLYGDADLDKELEFIDKNYLSDFERTAPIRKPSQQKPFKDMKKVTALYPVPEGAPTEKRCILALRYVVGTGDDTTLKMALAILAETLVNKESAPLRLALQKAGIGESVEARSYGALQNTFDIIIRNASPDDGAKLLGIVEETLRKTAKEGLDKKSVEGVLNRLEFQLREGNDAQKGIKYLFASVPAWMSYDNPFLDMEYEKTLTEFRASIAKGYLEEAISRHLLDNPHSAFLRLEPKPGLEKENETKEALRLAEYKASLKPEQIEALVKQTKELIEYQESEDSPEALASIPSLNVDDIDPKAAWDELAIGKVDGVERLHCEIFCNGITYATLHFDAQRLPVELIPYASLLSKLLGALDTENMSFQELEDSWNIQTGGFGFHMGSSLEDRDNAKFRPKFIAWSKCLDAKSGKMFELIGETLLRTKFQDKARLKTLISRIKADLEGSLEHSGISFASKRLMSRISRQGQFYELCGGLEFYWFIKDLDANFDAKSDEIIANLKLSSALLLSKDKLVATCTSGKEGLPAYDEALAKFTGSLKEGGTAEQAWAFTPSKVNEAILSSSKVQFACKGCDFKELGIEWNGRMKVLSQAISNEWLFPRIRVIGGAYGARCAFHPNGEFLLYSYRDPNLKETLRTFDGSPEFLEKMDMSGKEFSRLVIGAMASLDSPLTPEDRGSRAFTRHFENVSRETVQKERDETRSCKLEDVKAMGKPLSEMLAKAPVCVFGNEDKLKSEKGLFDKLTPLEPQKAP